MGRNGYAHMVLDYYVDQVRQVRRDRQVQLSQITTPAAASAYQERIRRAIAEAFQPRPPKTPLNPQVTGVLERDGYRVEKILFESRPGCLVTANLYVPDDLEGPAPCVLGTCGHSEPGKASDLYQAFCQRLVRTGFVALIYDPFDQGERDQYYGLDEDHNPGWGTRAHNMLGKQLELVGEFFGMWRAWDGVRALDYLLSRPEVDPSRVGLTGNSGGGTMTTWLWGIEDRFTMAAPSCFVTTFLHNLENELPADSEQCPPGVLGAGLEMADFLIAAAPKPVLLLGQKYDYFDRRGLQEAYEEVERFYQAVGAPAGNVDLFLGPQGHGYSVHNQEAMVAFFARHAGIPPVQVESTETLEEDALFATPEGEVIPAGGTRAQELVARQARELQSTRTVARPEALRSKLGELLGLPQRQSSIHYRNLRPVHKDDAVFARKAIETEGNVRAILWKRLENPEHPHTLDVEPQVRLYLPHVSSEDDLDQDRWAVSLQTLLPLYALDVRGLGESSPEEGRPGFFQPYGMDYMFHAYGLMMGQSYLGRRVHDVLATLDLLVHEGATSVHLLGRGQGAILALFSAVIHDHVTAITLRNGPRSFLEWTQVPVVAWPTANCLRNVLTFTDLPDCVRALNERLGPDNVDIADPWGPDMRPIDSLSY